MRTNNKTVGYGYVGRWNDGPLGWVLPNFLCGNGPKYPDAPSVKAAPFAAGEFMYKCKITIQAVKGKNGKPIRRRLVK